MKQTATEKRQDTEDITRRASFEKFWAERSDVWKVYFPNKELAFDVWYYAIESVKKNH